MKFLLTGGGTGGHIYPALTLWQTIQKHLPDAQILYVGTNRGLEHTIVPKEGLPFVTIEAAGLKRQVSVDAVKTMLTTYKGYRRAKGIIKDFQPDVVVGTGGYVTLPVVYAASQLRVPSVVWEANARPGLTNVLCSRRAVAVAVCFSDSERWFPHAKEIVLTGNPRASEVVQQDREEVRKARERYGIDPRRKLIVCFGGSRGAETINEVVLKLVPRFARRLDWQLLYITGEAHFEEIQQTLKDIPQNVRILPFIYDIPHVLPQAAVVVTRAGGATLAEICALGLPSILIPSPYVTANHQEENAKRLVAAGAARMILERELTADRLWRELEGVLQEQVSHRLRDAALAIATPDAVDKLYDTVLKAAHTRDR